MRSSDSSQIVDGTAMFSACRSAPRNLTLRPCIHRPLFLKANGRLERSDAKARSRPVNAGIRSRQNYRVCWYPRELIGKIPSRAIV